MEYQCNKLTVIPYSDGGEVSPYRDEVESESDGVKANSSNGAEVNMSSVGDVDISTEQLTVCKSTGAAMSAQLCCYPGECQGRT